MTVEFKFEKTKIKTLNGSLR